MHVLIDQELHIHFQEKPVKNVKSEIFITSFQ